MYKLLFVCALFVAAQADYTGYGHENAGYAAQVQPRLTVVHGKTYSKYGGYHGDHHGAHGLGNLAGFAESPRSALDGQVLGLAREALALPSAGAPMRAAVNVPLFHNTAYTAPAVHASPALPVGATGSTAAAAASNVDKNHAKDFGKKSYGHSY
ncbi:chorion protein 18 [Haematobia irritans]|uniref:chorion protein 18 n=1 Tax=Haematobia irritans TaxID=7368 RepID=UPI003F4F7DC3